MDKMTLEITMDEREIISDSLYFMLMDEDTTMKDKKAIKDIMVKLGYSMNWKAFGV